jgi:Ca2+-dependent lipid-binding protein
MFKFQVSLWQPVSCNMSTPVLNSKSSSQTEAAVRTNVSLDERRMLQKLQNEQIIVYLIICIVIVIAWILGSWHFSFVWIVGIAFITLIIWCNKVVKLTERNLQYREAALHRRQSLRESESAEWLNFLLNRWSVFTSPLLPNSMVAPRISRKNFH